ncbi:MICOS complex subunit Mic60 isoform X2 [Bacillus rossius redtenbacheri]|uniref:MICOS complex subunit Mic60 isoform X2 n=1 Tax=Bacillus rossius redtenbacheri TaxID=93214 RepID=UPI002FDEFA2A
MFRNSVRKVLCCRLSEVPLYDSGLSRLHLCLRYHTKNYTTGSLPPNRPSRVGRVLLYTVGTITLGVGGTVAYANYDPKFRKWLGQNVPYTDEFLKTVLQEEGNYWEQLLGQFDSFQTWVKMLIFGEEPEGKSIQKPKAAELPSKPSEVSPPKKTSEPKSSPSEKPKPAIVEPRVPRPKTFVELEEKIVVAASKAVDAYDKAARYLEDYNKEVNKIVESSVEHLDPSVWSSLRKKSASKDEQLKKAEEKASEAVVQLDKLNEFLSDPTLEASEAVRDQVKRNAERVMQGVKSAADRLEAEQTRASLADKYWRKVAESRRHFLEELETLFPMISIQDKKLKIPDDKLDLFVLYAYQNVLFCQKELHKLETWGEQRIQSAVKATGQDVDKVLLKELLHLELEKRLRLINSDFQKRMLELIAESEKEMKKQLRLQAEIHSDHIRDILKVREEELQRQFKQKLEESLAEEQTKYKKQLAEMLGRLKGIDAALKARAASDKGVHESQVLWNACQALYMSLKVAKPNVPWQEQLRPLSAEVSAVASACTTEDELISAVVKGIPPEAVTRGVYPENALRERFLKVEKEARRLALVPESGAALPVYVLSYLQSFLLIPAVNAIPQAELADETVSFEDLDTYDILLRARYWLDRGDFNRSLRYMNLLHGAARSIAKDWMDETRILLETQQAANVLMTHAASVGLLYL